MMSKKSLVIVESPSKSKTIGKYLGDNYLVLSSKGHVRDLATSGKGGLGVDVDNDFKATYSVSSDKKDTIKALKQAQKECDQVYLATDPDREGEAISWHLAEVLGLNVDETNRIEFHEVTKNAINQALQHPRKIDMDLVKSQETRRILDRIIGFKLSTLLNKKIKSKSAGRVQSVALKLIVDREAEINAFVPEEYWEVKASFTQDDINFETQLKQYNNEKLALINKEQVDKIMGTLDDHFTIESLTKATRSRNPKLAYITSTLQQDASNKLRFGAKRTMSIAQRLYEGIDLGGNLTGLITYMRTDSSRLAPEFVQSAFNYIKTNYGDNYVGAYHQAKANGAQDAHEAIRPTNIENTPDKIKQYLQDDEYKLYKMIYSRAVSSLMAPAKFDTTSIMLNNRGYQFMGSGSTLVFDGYLRLAKDFESVSDSLLPVLTQGSSLISDAIEPSQHFTEPPLRYSEARLIKKMEEEGIGRPSTYATIVDTIVARGYVTYEPISETSKTKVFKPTEQGALTSEQLDKFFSSIINVQYTANMETELDEIADGDLDNIAALHRFYDQFIPLLDYANENMEKKEPEKTGEKCPVCGHDLVYRMGRYGKFISCSDFPNCRYVAKIVDPNKYVPQPSGKLCPRCGAELLRRKSRYNTFFLGCSNFPKCNYMETEDGVEIVAKAKASKTTSSTKSKSPTAKKASTKKVTTKKSSKKTTKKTSAVSKGKRTLTRKGKSNE